MTTNARILRWGVDGWVVSDSDGGRIEEVCFAVDVECIKYVDDMLQALSNARQSNLDARWVVVAEHKRSIKCRNL